MISIIAVIGKNRELGKDNQLLFNIPEDLKRFRRITTGHPVIMGRKTFESIGHPLPNRANFVITHDDSCKVEGMTAVLSLEAAIRLAEKEEGSEEIFIIGGGQIYAQAIDIADRLYLTVVESDAAADTFFPNYERFTKVINKESHDNCTYRYTYLTLER